MMETDDELRARVQYVAGDIRELGVSGGKLDEVAWRYNLKRRKRDVERTQPIVRVGVDPGYTPNGYVFLGSV